MNAIFWIGLLGYLALVTVGAELLARRVERRPSVTMKVRHD
jgi:hypothetical protein